VGGNTSDWEAAYDEAANLLKSANGKVLFLGSAHATVEDNYLLMKLAETVGADAPQYLSRIQVGSGDDWLISDDPAPNTQGCERLGMNPADPVLLKAKLAGGDIEVLYVLEEDPIAAGVLSADELSGIKVILHHYHTTNETLAHADVALPAAMCVETIGTYVNEAGRAQRLRPAKMIRSMNRSLMMEAGVGQSRTDRHGTPFDRWYNEDHQIDCQPGWEALPAIAERLGAPMRYKNPAAIMTEVAETIPAFSGATHKAMDLLGVALEEVGEAV
jgi:NADH-quinone oxidoreductase subunit G